MKKNNLLKSVALASCMLAIGVSGAVAQDALQDYKNHEKSMEYVDALRKGVAVGEQDIENKKGGFSFLAVSNEQTMEFMPIIKQVAPEMATYKYGMLGVARIDSSVIDLNNDGTAEIIFKASGSSACDYLSCPIVIAEYDEDDGWKSILKAKASTVSYGQIGESGYADLQLDNVGGSYSIGGLYKFDGGYKRDFSAIADAVEWLDVSTLYEREDLVAFNDMIERDLGADYFFMKSMTTKADRMLMAQTDLNSDGTPEWLVFVDAKGACLSGCPMFVYRDFSEAPVFTFKPANDHVSVERQPRPSTMRSFYMAQDDGYGVAEWDRELATYTVEMLN